MDKREVIMDHYSNPRNRKRINDSSYLVEKLIYLNLNLLRYQKDY